MSSKPRLSDGPLMDEKSIEAHRPLVVLASIAPHFEDREKNSASRKIYPERAVS